MAESKLGAHGRALAAAARTVAQTYAAHRKPIARAIYVALAVAVLNRVRQGIREVSRKEDEAKPDEAKPGGLDSLDRPNHPDRRDRQHVHPQVDAQFVRDLVRLLRIAIPGWRSREARLLATHSVLLVVRTLLSVQIAALDGALVQSLVRGRGRDFMRRIAVWMVLAVPATATNALLAYHQAALGLRYRARLTQHLHAQYLDRLAFYQLAALDDRLRHPDQVVAADVAHFAAGLAALYGNVAKPLLDVVVYGTALARGVGTGGGEAVVGMALLVQLSALGLRALTPPLGRFVADEARLDADLRFRHARLQDHAEAVGLAGGHAAEKNALDRAYFTLVKHANHVLRRRLPHALVEDYVIKYVWGALGLALCSVPVFVSSAVAGAARSGSGSLPKTAMLPSVADLADHTRHFVTNRRLLLSASDASGRLLLAYRDVLALAGHTARVAQLLDVLADVRAGRFQKALVADADHALLHQRGTVVEGDYIEFDNVPIVSPSGDILLHSLSFALHPGQHLLVIGPNGCGKSSLFRILGGLWPVYGGTVRRPPPADIFYIPQRPYLFRGSLRQQLIYPDAHSRCADTELLDLLEPLGLLTVGPHETEHETETETETEAAAAAAAVLDHVAEWRDSLSIGAQQRLAMARLLYHRPRFAILDECTSSVTLDMERRMYALAKQHGVSLMTVSHRRSLWAYHTHLLQFDGHGHYLFTRLDAARRLRLEDEKDELDARLRQVPDLEARLAELDA